MSHREAVQRRSWRRAMYIVLVIGVIVAVAIGLFVFLGIRYVELPKSRFPTEPIDVSPYPSMTVDVRPSP